MHQIDVYCPPIDSERTDCSANTYAMILLVHNTYILGDHEWMLLSLQQQLMLKEGLTYLCMLMLLPDVASKSRTSVRGS